MTINANTLRPADIIVSTTNAAVSAVIRSGHRVFSQFVSEAGSSSRQSTTAS
jgi:hypothetical protein